MIRRLLDFRPNKWTSRLQAVGEVVLMALLCFVFSGSPPPGDDEAHYLGKAKHYFNPEWLANDFFLNTADAHQTFNWTLGWLTLFFSLATVAWIGRFTAWILLAWAWRRLAVAIVPRPLMGLLTLALFLVFQEYGNVAREWIVRGVEAKCFAYVFVLLGLEAIVRGRWSSVWPLLGIASAMHVLVGGWAVVAAGITYVISPRRQPVSQTLPWLILGGVLSLPGLVPALWLTRGVDATTVMEANYIYVFERLSHHLLAHEFGWTRILRFHILILIWAGLCFALRGETKAGGLWRFVGASLAIAVCGVVIDQATLYYPDLAARLLRYYWYRLADVMVPIGLAMVSVEGVSLWAKKQRHPRIVDLAWGALVLVPLTILTVRSYHSLTDHRSGADAQGQISQEQYDGWLVVCHWIEANTPQDATILTPPNTTTLRWHAHRAEVVSWKDIPQDAAGIVQWRERLHQTNAFWASVAYGDKRMATERLVGLIREYGVGFVIVDQLRYPTFEPSSLLRQVFPQTWQVEAAYKVYEVRSP